MNWRSMPDTLQPLLTPPPGEATICDESVVKCYPPRTQLAPSCSGVGRWVALGLLVVALPPIALLQSELTPRAGPPADRSAQDSASSTAAPFKISVAKNLVVVRVVVRDSKGQAVGDLTKNDFLLLDNGHPQVVSTFAVDRVPGRSSEPASAARPETSIPAVPAPPAPVERYVALFFDDVHASVNKFGNLANLHQTAQAARAFLAADMQPGDRIGLFTASGKPEVDFTGDRTRLEQALDTLRPRPLVDTDSGCPRLTDYEAYLIAELQNPAAIAAGQSEANGCLSEERVTLAQARWLLDTVKAQSNDMLDRLNQLVRRMAVIPGQRFIVLLSPGFYSAPVEEALEQVTDEAVRCNVVIDSLNAEGLVPDAARADPSSGGVAVGPGGQGVSPDVLNRSSPPRPYGSSVQFFYDAAIEHDGVLADFAANTGGQLFHNNNDYHLGLRRLIVPEISYTLAFSPAKLKYDGSFHRLKVKLLSGPKYEVQARRGYFAPKQAEDAATAAREQLREVVLSRQELQAIPIEVRTQFFKSNNGAASLSVLTRVDVSGLHFRKAKGKNFDDLNVVTAVFDLTGHYVGGEEKQIHLREVDSSLARLSRTGLTVKSTFTVRPGAYQVRTVVQDSEPDRLSAANRSVEIPF